MIRFVDLGKQIGLDEEWPREFAYFDTIVDLFVKVNDEHLWASWDEFKESYRMEHTTDAPENFYPLERFENLCHPWAKEAVSPWM